MHPNVFLKSFWRLEVRPEIFVAMSFDDKFKSRYDDVIAPAISRIDFHGKTLRSKRVDLSNSGDSVITEILDGIAHSQMVLADISTYGSDSVTGKTYRNGNVMFEVGVALACRQPEETLLILGDKDRSLFDVSMIPYMRVNFAKQEEARDSITKELTARLKQRQYMHDSRVQLAAKSLSPSEASTLTYYAAKLDNEIGSPNRMGLINELTYSRLLDKQLIEIVGRRSDDRHWYRATTLVLQRRLVMVYTSHTRASLRF